MDRNLRLLRRASSALLIAAVALLALLAVGVVMGRWQAAPVLTGSMQPAIGAGDLIIAEARPTSDLAVGDVIVFHAPTPGRPVTVHRIVSLEQRDDTVAVVTKGDANEEVDAWGGFEITAPRTWTVTRSIAGVGRLVLAVRSPLIQLAAFVLLAIAAAAIIDRARARRPVGRGPGRPPSGGVGATRTQPLPAAPADTPLVVDRALGQRIAVAGALTATLLVAVGAASAVRAALTDREAGSLAVSTGSLAPPSDLTATASLVLDACEVVLAWTPSPSTPATGYEILRQPLESDLMGSDPAPGGPYEVALSVEGRETTTATDTLPAEVLQLNSQFRYVARTVRDGWRSSDSNTADVDVLGVCR